MEESTRAQRMQLERDIHGDQRSDLERAQDQNDSLRRRLRSKELTKKLRNRKPPTLALSTSSSNRSRYCLDLDVDERPYRMERRTRRELRSFRRTYKMKFGMEEQLYKELRKHRRTLRASSPSSDEELEDDEK